MMAEQQALPSPSSAGDPGQSGDAVGAAMQETREELPHGSRKMEFTDLKLVEIIGGGTFAEVFRGYWKRWNGEVAIKKGRIDDMEKQVCNMSELKHPNIITLYGTAAKDPHLYIVMEFAERGSLYDHIQKNRGKPNMNLSLRWAVDIAEGMNYIHEQGIAHRNLKSPIVLLTSSLRAKIGSFSVACRLDDTTDATMVGTYAWMAPEVMKGEKYSKRCDLFSYGTVLWELVSHEVPFEDVREAQLDLMVAIANGKRPDIPADVEGFLTKLIQQCWNDDPEERPSFVESLKVLKPHLQAKDMVAALDHKHKIEFGAIQLGKEIGCGKFGTVYRGQWDKQNVAIKKIDCDNIIEREVRIMFELKQQPKIITLYGTACKNDDLYIVMELAECSLYEHIGKRKGKPDMETGLRWAAEVAEGMRYLHENEIVHRDLKSLNILLTTVASVKVAKICDFGTARKLDREAMATWTGTPAWMAPEVIKGEPYSKRCDLYSYGTVLWELVTHKVPFEEFEGVVTYAIGNGQTQELLPIPPETRPYLSSLIWRCWEMDSSERPTFVEILSVLDEKEIIQEHAMKFAHLVFGEHIGTTGNVFKGRWTLKDRAVAIKALTYDKYVAREVSIVFQLKHPNIIMLYGTVSKGPHLYTVMELAECSLYEHIGKHKGKPDMEISLRWAVEVAEGLEYLHDNDVVHRNLKSHNVLLTSELRAKICDFGISRQMDHTTQATMASTYSWMSPEVITEAAYSKKIDLYSYGMVLWELVTHKVPFEEFQGSAFRMQLAIVKGQMPVIPADVEGYLSELIQRCWNNDPRARPSFVDVLAVLKPHLPADDFDGDLEIKADSKPQLQHLELLPCADTPIRVAAEIKDKWQKVARKLDIPAKVTKEIKQESSTAEQQALAMLRRWREGGYECEDDSEELPVPTWKILMAALTVSGYEHVADKISQRLAPSTS